MAQRATTRLPKPLAAVEYSIDAWQRPILFLDVLRRRAAQAEEHAAQTARTCSTTRPSSCWTAAA